MNWKKKVKYKKHLSDLARKKKSKLRKPHKEMAAILKNEQIKLKNKNEITFKNILDEFEINYIWQQPFYDDERYVCVDFYFKNSNIVVEIDGKEHYQPHNVKKDAKRTKYLKDVHNVKEVLRIDIMQLYYNKEDIIDLILDKID